MQNQDWESSWDVFRELDVLLSAPWAQQKDIPELESWSIYHIINDPKLLWRRGHRAEPQVLTPVNLSVGGCCCPARDRSTSGRWGRALTKSWHSARCPWLLQMLPQEVFWKMHQLKASFFKNPVFFLYSCCAKSQRPPISFWEKARVELKYTHIFCVECFHVWKDSI